ncbi:phosphoinositide-binding protein, putative [Trypanosoma brucei gambiense DAL972]|uniref:Phosphoinositide-binding protein, putative n=3 Tax=Trypanosoma brucei TaxID=5691 RepID=Q38D86_TRYB2|nr:phosphoinositide-binding protein, putative [Trypanosoma brucei gambiense DAL972]XP_827564.1 phosphoinositide-binding protein, putative [Trypanosoma brucei brucei TREU927]EAN77234.1 phosphoinositide-binding protein, putative [Trypanosoma brucei brucei TREU927]RHW70377.1 Autophagy-related protein 24 [Trypanosoma brucei equiperdum]CBH14761.1 phosphoinositide-binding protein, putative [Trypanosoma brucei gambiense DAL972]|eukprot:XP_011777027.1 phosphoinositide-binding protein, putative [Trypanosoma brucei gambiense DAL972]
MSENVFEFRVLEPEERKGGGALDLAYWMYRIRTSTTLPMYPRKEMEVVRRYNDFVWFRTQLCEAYPYCIIPPIPEKEVHGTFNKIVGSASQSATRTRDYRQRALKKFLTRVGAHPRLRTAQLLQEFLEMDETEWERRMQAPVAGAGRSLRNSIGDSVGQVLSRTWNDAQTLEDAGAAYSQAVNNGAVDMTAWEGTRRYIKQLDESMKVLREQVQVLVDRRRNTSNSLHEFGVAFEKVAEVDGMVGQSSLTRVLSAVGQHNDQLSTLYVEHANDETKQVVETLSYYHGMCGSVRATLKHLLQSAHHVEALARQLEGLRAQRDKVLDQVGQAARRAKLENEISEQEQLLERARQELTDGEAIFKEEIHRFHRDKQYDIKTILKMFADLQIKYAGRLKQSWEKLSPLLTQGQPISDHLIDDD